MKDKSLENVDVFKLFGAAFIFIAFFALLIFFILLPELKTYKELNLKENTQREVLQTEVINLEESKARFEILQDSAGKDLMQIQSKFHQDHFEAFLKKYFVDFKFDNADLPKEQYLAFNFNFEGLLSDKAILQDFFSDLNEYESIIKLNFPVIISMQEDGILLKFQAQIYTSDDLNSKFR